LILTVHEDRGLMEDAIHAGAGGYILKSAIKSELINAIHTVLHDDLYLQPAMARLLFAKTAPLSNPAETENLTAREIEILRLLAQGYTNRQAAELLNLSVRTVEYHRGNLTAKLNLHSRVELVRYVEDHGLV
jgi:DNA-binding NarL/FixJ family response regulator